MTDSIHELIEASEAYLRRFGSDGVRDVVDPATVEHEGTFPLPEAQLDRFFLRTALGYPEIEDELKILEQQRFSAQEFFASDPNDPPFTEDWTASVAAAWTVRVSASARAVRAPRGPWGRTRVVAARPAHAPAA